MDCKELEALLSQRTLAELAPDERAAVAAHVDACPACREKWGLDQQSQVLHDSAKALRPNGSVKEAVLSKLGGEDQAPAAPEAKDAAQEPKRLGGFELLGRLGKGGMGTVLKARQVSIDRLVALKILPKRLAENKAFVQRFIREARSAARLRHPNIVAAYDVGFVDGYYFFAMEFVDGETLADILRREGRLEPNRVLHILKQVTSALAAAHEAGIVHRDIKPSNIMLDKKGEVRVTDFGLAKRTEGDVDVTQVGQALGTPLYLAPEVASGEPADARSDLYSLGATFYHLLAGRPPFEGKTAPQLIIKHVNEAPLPLCGVAPGIDPRFPAIIDRLLSKRPADRYASAQALLDELDSLGPLEASLPPPVAVQVDTGAPTATLPQRKVARPPHSAARAHRPRAARKTHTAPVLIAVASAVALLVIVIAISRARRAPEPSPSAVIAPPPSARKAEEAAKALADQQLAGAIAELQSKARALSGQDRFGQALEQVEAFSKGRPPSEGGDAAKELRDEILAGAEKRYQALVGAADAAIKQKDYAKARDALRPVGATFGIPELADRARKKLAEIDSREKGAAAWAKWDDIKGNAKKLTDADKFDEAAQLLDGAKALPLDGIADLIPEQVESIESTKSTRLKAALAAYQAESDKLWDLFKQRDYPAADALLKQLAADPRFVGGASLPRVPPRAGDGPPTIQDMLAADQGAAKLLKEFWTAVERGVMARKGKFVSIAGRGGNVESVANGQVTLKVGTRELTAPLLGMDAAQAVALVDLKDDERGNLTRAIFLLAESEKLDDAAKLLAAAGNLPSLANYKDRLSRVVDRARAEAKAKDVDAREAAARKAWEQILELSKGKLTASRAGQLLGMLDSFQEGSGGTELYRTIREEIAGLRAKAQESAQEHEPRGPNGIETAQKMKAEVIWSVDLPKEFRGAKLRPTAHLTVSSFFSRDYRPEFAIDDKPNTEFAFQGPKGTIEFDYGKGVRCTAAVFHARALPDRMREGVVIVNGKIRLRFHDFGGGNILIVRTQGALVRTITIESVEGNENPGISDSYLIR